MKEPDIIINGHVLSEGEAVTIRVAIQNFAMQLQSEGLGKDKRGRAICAAYLANIDRIISLMLVSAGGG